MSEIATNVTTKLDTVDEIIRDLSLKSSGFIVNVVIALLVMIIGYRIVAFIEKRLKKPNRFKRLDPSVKSFFISFITVSLKVLLMVIVLSIVGVPMASLVTVIGSCAVAIGLALQGGLSNIAGGLMLLIFKPFKVGDFINACGCEGTVKSITIFYTTIVTIDNKVVQLPNGNLSNSSIINYSANKTRRVDLEISVSYNSDIEKVKKILTGIVDKHKLILHDEEKFCRLKTHGSSALIFVLRVWVNTGDYWTVYFDLMENIKKEFDKNNIEIPFEQLDVHMIK